MSFSYSSPLSWIVFSAHQTDSTYFGVERPVGVVEIDPEPDPLGHRVPVLDVAEHLLAAAGVELGDPVALDVVLGRHPELGLDRQLDRQAVAVPAALALDVVPDIVR